MPSALGLEPSHVFDLPQIWTKPSCEALTSTLALLRVEPPSWSEEKELTTYVQDSKAVATYLTQIVSSSLKWLDEEQREVIYEMASKRLSERSGRTGMSAITRTWKIPATSSCPEITLRIHEPPLTEDHLGLKTWASSYLLAKRLENLGLKHLKSISKAPNFRGLELGSGTGLVGLAAASIWGCSMHLTDLPDILPNLALNAERNTAMITSRGGQVTTAVHDWQNPPGVVSKFHVILAADPLYSPDHPILLARNIAEFLSSDPRARAIIELPMRDKSTEAMCQDLQNLMLKENFDLLEDGFESGFDDWEKNCERGVVRCWWGVFSRKV